MSAVATYTRFATTGLTAVSCVLVRVAEQGRLDTSQDTATLQRFTWESEEFATVRSASAPGSQQFLVFDSGVGIDCGVCGYKDSFDERCEKLKVGCPDILRDRVE